MNTRLLFAFTILCLFASTIKAQNENATTELVHSRGIIHSNQEKYNYFGWPSVARLPDGKLIAVSSGYREGHVDMFGKVVASYSDDEGITWTVPRIIMDSPLDERDAGVIVWKDKVFITTFTHFSIYDPNGSYFIPGEYQESWKTMYEDVTQADLDLYQYAYYAVSNDGGYTFEYAGRINSFSPHGMLERKDGSLYYVGYAPEGDMKGIFYVTSEDGIHWTPRTVIDGNSGLVEPHAIQLRSGKIIVQARSQTGIVQCESTDNGQTYTPFKLIFSNDGAKGTPPHLYQHSNGTLVMTYGHRAVPFGIHARVSYDEGESWKEDILLTDDAPRYINEFNVDWSWDLGYPATIEREDGKLLTVYYQRLDGSHHNTSWLYLVWDAPLEHNTITFKTRGGTEIPPLRIEKGKLAQKPADPQREGHLFKGWYTDMTLSEEFVFGELSDDVYAYAKWERDPASTNVTIEALTPSYLSPVSGEEVGGITIESGYKYTKTKGVSANIDGGIADAASIWINGTDLKQVKMKAYIKITTGNVHLQVKKAHLSSVTRLDGTPVTITSPKYDEVWFSDTQAEGWYTITLDIIEPKAYLVTWATAAGTLYFTDLEAITEDNKYLEGGDYDLAHGPRVLKQSLSTIHRLDASDLSGINAFTDHNRSDTYAFYYKKEAGFGAIDGGINGKQAFCLSTIETGAIYKQVSFDLYVIDGSKEKPIWAVGNDPAPISRPSIKNKEGQEMVADPSHYYTSLEKVQWYTVTIDLSTHGEQVYYFGSWSGDAVEFYYTNFVWESK